MALLDCLPLKQENQQLRNKVSELAGQAAACQARVAELEKELRHSQRQLQQKERQILDLECRADILTDVLEEHVSEKKQLAEQLHALAADHRNLANDYRALQHQLSASERDGQRRLAECAREGQHRLDECARHWQCRLALLEWDLAARQRELAALERDLAASRRVPEGDLETELQARARRIAVLERKIVKLEKLLDETRREGKRQASPFAKGPPKAKPKKNGRKKGARHGRHNHRPPPTHIDETYEVPLPEKCPCCGGALHEMEIVFQYQTEIPRRPIQREFRIHVGQCQECGERVPGRHPLQTSDATGAAAAQLGPDAQAAVVLLNKDAGLSYGKISRLFHDLHGINLTRGGAARIVARAGRRCEPAYAEIKESIRNAEVLWLDETGWREGGHPAWLHVWTTPQATCYAVDRSRSADRLEQVIGLDWEGMMHHDGYATYNRFTAALHQQCCGHVLQRCHEMLQTATGGAVCFPRQVSTLFHDAMEVRGCFDEGQITLDNMNEQRAVFEARLEKLVTPTKTNEANERLATHLDNHFGEWFLFLSMAEVEATNNYGEGKVRTGVMLRKGWGGNRTPVGSHTQEVLTSALVTCSQQQKDKMAFLSGTLRGQRPSLLAGGAAAVESGKK